jgi:hypothetical protein
MDSFFGPKAEWEAYRDMQSRPGYGKLTVANGTHAVWEMVGIDASTIIDTFSIEKQAALRTARRISLPR